MSEDGAYWTERLAKPTTPPEPPRCPECGYSAQDQHIHGDHHFCKGKIPEQAARGAGRGREVKSSVRILREQSSLTGCQWQDDIADEIEEADARIAALERLVAQKDEALRKIASQITLRTCTREYMKDIAQDALDLKCEEVPG